MVVGIVDHVSWPAVPAHGSPSSIPFPAPRRAGPDDDATRVCRGGNRRAPPRGSGRAMSITDGGGPARLRGASAPGGGGAGERPLRALINGTPRAGPGRQDRRATTPHPDNRVRNRQGKGIPRRKTAGLQMLSPTAAPGAVERGFSRLGHHRGLAACGVPLAVRYRAAARCRTQRRHWPLAQTTSTAGPGAVLARGGAAGWRP